MNRFLSVTFVLLLSGCALFVPKWKWERPGATDADYEADIRYCKTQTDQSLDGTVTNASVRRIHHCMERQGWRKVER